MVNSGTQLGRHQHGKSKVRVGRVWRDGSKHIFKEWSVDTVLESDMAHAYLEGSNEGMTATDTQKNTVYYVAKKLPIDAAPEDFALALARHFVKTYEPVSKARVWVKEMPWVRNTQDGKPHTHAYMYSGGATRTAYADCDAGDTVSVQGGVTEWKLLKTTQSGYEGYAQDEYTKLKETTDRMLASSITATWTFAGEQPDYHQPFEAAKAALAETFFGPPDKGVYSPSVQFTLYRMGEAALQAAPALTAVTLNMPNIHYLPCDPVNTEGFENDVFVATSEPHGTIEATVEKSGAKL